MTALVHALLLWAILHPRCVWLGAVVSRFATEKNEVWLTIDDGPCEHTPQLAEALRTRGVRATFFVIGERLAEHPGTARALRSSGHSLANHSHTHPRKTFWLLSRRRVTEEFDQCAAILRDSGIHSRLFRPPVGHKPPALHPALASRNAPMIAWSTGGRDGWHADPSATVRRIESAARPGAIILLHEGRAHSLATILAVVDALLARGFTFTIPDPESLYANLH